MNPNRSKLHEHTAPATRTAVCDFCGQHPPVQSFACRPFTRRVLGPAPLVVRYLDAWAACSTCAPLVNSRSWHALAVRVVNCSRPTLPGALADALHAEATDLFQHLTRHLTGNTAPFQEQR